ncbi:hypothetical protein ACH5RR_039941 [Cinchona calisaya]|uniref:Uncharacterized protein n=1 Tax=Cinchona calisaya TaxID=153742 RepID=A0ABD2Y045_9GENT
MDSEANAIDRAANTIFNSNASMIMPVLRLSMVKKNQSINGSPKDYLLEAVERLDKERKERDKALRLQELEKLEQNAANKTSEWVLGSSRGASIVAFLPKITSQTINLPPSDVQPGAISSRTINVELISSSNKADKEDLSINFKNRRWPKAEMEALIRIRASLEQKFQGAAHSQSTRLSLTMKISFPNKLIRAWLQLLGTSKKLNSRIWISMKKKMHWRMETTLMSEILKNVEN